MPMTHKVEDMKALLKETITHPGAGDVALEEGALHILFQTGKGLQHGRLLGSSLEPRRVRNDHEHFERGRCFQPANGREEFEIAHHRRVDRGPQEALAPWRIEKFPWHGRHLWGVD